MVNTQLLLPSAISRIYGQQQQRDLRCTFYKSKQKASAGMLSNCRVL